MSKIEQLDMQAVQAALFAGEKMASVAATANVSVTYLFRIVQDSGLAYAWTTAEERQQLASLRSGQSVVVRKDEASSALRLHSRIEAALREFRSSEPSSPAAYRSEARNAANRGVVPAAPAQREQRSVSGS